LPSWAKSPPPDTNAVIFLLTEAKKLQRITPDSAFKLAEDALILSQQLNYSKGIGSACMRLGAILSDQGRNDSALLYLKRSYATRKNIGDFKNASGSCIQLSYIYQQQGAKDSAFYYLYESLRLCKLANDSGKLAQTCTALGSLFSDYGDSKNALTWFLEAAKIAEATQDIQNFYLAHEGLGFYYYDRNEFEKALYYLLKVDSIMPQLGDAVLAAKTLNNVGLCYSSLKNYTLAKKYYQQALQEYTRLDMPLDIALAYFNLGSMYNNLNQPDSAIYYLDKSLPLARESGDLQRASRCYEFLADAYALKGNYSKAYDYHLHYTSLRDSLLNEEKISSIAEMQTKYDTEKKEQQIVLLDEQGKTRKAQRNFFIAGSVVLLLGLFVLGFYYWQRQKLTKKNEQLAQQKIEGLLNETELKTYNAMIEGQEEERKRIASDLHDRLGSMLATVKLLFSSLDTKIDKAQDENTKQYERANTLLDEACSEVRRISHNLSTGMVMSFGLVPALQELCDSVDQSGLIKCRLMTYGMSERLDQSVETGVYRIVQELFSNILKHAKAQHIVVQLNHVESSLNITVEDDGVGFNVEEKKQSGGMGLKNLSKRAEQLNGLYNVDSHPGKGTISIIEIPILKDNT